MSTAIGMMLSWEMPTSVLRFRLHRNLRLGYITGSSETLFNDSDQAFDLFLRGELFGDAAACGLSHARGARSTPGARWNGAWAAASRLGRGRGA